MFTGLKSAFRRGSSDQAKSGPVRSSIELDKILIEDTKTRKKCLSNLCWFHETTKTRYAAEIKLKQSYGAVKLDGVFLIRRSTACSADFVLSFYANGSCQHYNIQFNCTFKFGFEKGPTFSGLDNLVLFYQEQDSSNELPCRLSKPCPGGELPPPLSLSIGYTNKLHKAVVEENSETALKIISHSTCPALDDRDDKGNTALHLAAIAGLDSVVESLIQKGATVSAWNLSGYSALQLACTYDRPLIAHMLIVRGEASPQQRVPVTGNVPLHLAAEKGHIETVEMLLSLDVPSHSRNYNQKTPYDLAMSNGHLECAKIIDDYEPPPAIVSSSDWLHEKVNRELAVALLSKHIEINGLFLVRKSSQNEADFVLSICCQRRIKHYIISNFMNVYFIDDGPLLPSLEHLIEYYCVYADGLASTLQHSLSPTGAVISLTALSEDFNCNSLPDVPPRDRPPAALEPMVLSRDSIEMTYELGQGEYGSVMKGTWKAPSGELVPVAIKTMNQQHLASGTDGFMREAQVMVRLDHPCIVKLIGICQGPPLMLVQELLSMGSLLDFLLDYPDNVDIIVDLPLWAVQIAFGMKYLEKQGMVHRDLAARNILLASKSQVKICDFGLSRAVGANSDYYRAAQGGRWPVKWYAPESINYGTFSSASDVWGYGVTLWEMYSFGDQPYNEMTGAQVLQFVERKGRLQRPDGCPESMYLLMRQCWSLKSADRPTFKQIYHELQLGKSYENVQTLRETSATSKNC